MQHQWIRWFNGYLVVCVKGKRLERLINLAVQKKMNLWHITRNEKEKAALTLGLEDFFLLKPLLRETNCRIHIISKQGLPFLLTKIRKRHAFLVGFAVFVMMLYLLSSMIWTVEVKGTEQIADYEVKELAAQLGIKQGTFTFFLDDPHQLQAQLLEKLPEASWVGFKLQGTKAEIRVVEKVFPEEQQAQTPRNIVSTKSAMILNVFATKGKPLVKQYDFVKKGDILVSGLIGKEEVPVAVAATGKVEGEVW
jgi:similar to stage IV sporulation protein